MPVLLGRALSAGHCAAPVLGEPTVLFWPVTDIVSYPGIV